MAKRLKEVDVVLVGMGWAGAIFAKELAEAGLTVVGLERGRMHETVPDWQGPDMQDELRYGVRLELLADASRETITLRNRDGEQALPVRQPGAFAQGNGVGGSGVHWGGQALRFQPTDFRYRSHHLERYGRDSLPADLTVQDWGLDYADLEPYYAHFERVCGVGGIAGNVGGTLRPGGNPFEGPRSGIYPNPPMKQPLAGALFGKAAAALGCQPFPLPSANLSRSYVNPYGARLKACLVCGYCDRFGCGHFAKASPQVCILPFALRNPNFVLRPRSQVTRVLLDADGHRATGVVFLDAEGQAFEQPAQVVVLCASGLSNVHLLLVSGIGEPYDPQTGQGLVGKNFACQTISSVSVFFDESVQINPFMGAGALGTVIDDFNGDNFDHSGLGFIGGGPIACCSPGGTPIRHHPVPPGTPRWGLAWKQAVARHYNHTATVQCLGASVAHRSNHLSLDPTWRDAFGRPLLRMNFDFPLNDRRMSSFITDRTESIARAMGGHRVHRSDLPTVFGIAPDQTMQGTGGAIMGASPAESVVNRFLQSWQVPNLFVQGSCVFPQNPGHPPTATVGALAYWSARALIDRYVRQPGPMVQA